LFHFLLLSLFCKFYYFAHFAHNTLIIFPYVRNYAAGAILDALFYIRKIAATLITQGIQGAVTEQAAEIFRILALVAGKIFTGTVLEEIVVCHSLTPLI
jgi:hypothetical protein